MNKVEFSSEEIQAFVARPHYDPAVILSKDAAYPRISVIVPSFNQAQFLERTFLSILNQNYPNTEIIVMDGGSRDGSVEIIQRYAPYISYWTSDPDKGQPSAINKGFEKASGDLVGWQNSDDLYLPGFFHVIAESFRVYPRAQLFTGNIYTVDETDHITWASRFPPFSANHLIYLDWNLSSQAVFLKRQLALQVGPIREDIPVGFDWDWFIRVGKVMQPHGSILHRVYGGCYRIHSASKFSTQAYESRWRIETQILRSYGIRVKEELPYLQQPWWQRRFFQFRMKAYNFLLYQPAPLFQHLRPLFIWFLAKVGTVCEGFA